MNIREKLSALYPSISAFFITHPRTAWVVAIAISLVGAISLSRLAVAEYPSITPVTITVLLCKLSFFITILYTKSLLKFKSNA